MVALVRDRIETSGGRVDYVEVACTRTLEPKEVVGGVEEGDDEALVAVAAYFEGKGGKEVRLLDNTVVVATKQRPVACGAEVVKEAEEAGTSADALVERATKELMEQKLAYRALEVENEKLRTKLKQMEAQKKSPKQQKYFAPRKQLASEAARRIVEPTSSKQVSCHNRQVVCVPFVCPC